MDEKLKDSKMGNLLSKWQDIEPSASFDSVVWGKIQGLSAKKNSSLSLFELLGFRPVYAVAAAVAGILIGITGAMAVLPQEKVIDGSLFKPFPENSISASFINLTGGL